ncbi:MAG: hypothetical protein QXG86_01045 [Candidatus Woesearchaeota archaeon]
MIITINTKEDSREDIKKVIQMLMRLIEEQPSTQSAPLITDGILNMFDNSLQNSQDKEEKEEHNNDRIEIYDY